jgi:threonyl-tRNA synthetase
MRKVPFMVILGDKEVEDGAVAVRRLGGQDLGVMPLDGFVKLAVAETKPPRWS